MITTADCEKLFEQCRSGILGIKDIIGDRKVCITFDSLGIVFEVRENLSTDSFASTEVHYTPPTPAKIEVRQNVYDLKLGGGV